MSDWIRAVSTHVPDVAESFSFSYLTAHPKGHVERVESSGGAMLLWIRDRGETPVEHEHKVLAIRWRWDLEGSEPLPPETGKFLGRFRDNHGDHWLVFEKVPSLEQQEASAPRTPATRRLLPAPAETSGPDGAGRRGPSRADLLAARAASTPGTARSTWHSQERPRASTAQGPTPRPRSGPSPTTRQEQ